MDLGPYLTFDGIDYACTLCERVFASKSSLYAHCRNTSRHEWCERCCRVFISAASKDAHLKASGRHNFCPRCSPSRDFEILDELETHLTGYHHFCSDCNLYHQSAEELREHDIDVHNLCIKCKRYFVSKNNFEMHQQKHQPRTMECCGCYKNFKSFSGALIHLESGGCSSNITEDDIDDLARQCYQSRKYINDELADGGWVYTCPHCVTEFSKLSALYQHAEDVPSCSYLAKGHGCLAKLERFISRNLEQ